MLSVNLRLTQFKREIELVTPNTTLAKPFLTILGSSAKISSNHKKLSIVRLLSLIPIFRNDFSISDMNAVIYV